MKTDIYYQNEIEILCSQLTKSKTVFSHYVLVGEENSYFFRVLKDGLSACKNISFSCNDEQFSSMDFCVITVLNSSSSKAELLELTENILVEKSCGKCIICDENTADATKQGFLVAEREYTFLCRDKNSLDKSKELLKKSDTLLLVFDEIIGPQNGFAEILTGIEEKNEIKVSDSDVKSIKGYTYIRDAFSAVILALTKLKKGNIYNVSSFSASDFQIKQEIYSCFNDKFSLSCSLSVQGEKVIKALCPLKIKNAGLDTVDLKTAVFSVVSSFFGFEYDYSKNLAQYCSKLEILKKVEIDILKEIDRICKKHNIKYFLTGGSLLGAVRYNKSIPWDDDLDIGMLRKDFEKFRKICPQELDKEKFAYASYTTEESCHYLFDKIRLKNTYFSTPFPAQFKIQNGVFVDVLVYDTTSPSRIKQKLHINLVKTAIRFLNIKWTGKADRTMNGYKLSLLVKPVLRFVPFKFIHMYTDGVLRMYKRKRSDFLIDGTGLNINRGAFKKNLLENTIEVDFEGFKVPIPENYDGFLKHVYGENYLEEPAISKRNGTHDFVRLDLGEYILKDGKISDEQNLDGELF